MDADQQYRQVFVADGGEEFAGSYYVADGRLHLTSPYGSGSTRLGRRETIDLAETLFAEILDGWCGR
jgi:hypothetical protein